MSLNITSITINTAEVEPMLQFYSCLGLKFHQVQVSKGSSIYRTHIGTLEFSIFTITQVARKTAPALQLTFKLENLESTVKSLIQIPNVMCVLDPIELDGAMKAILIDPDGHSVELIEE